MTDNYEFMRSSNVQKPNTPYSSKQWNYVNDINSGVYSNQGQTLIQYDLTSIFNSSRMIDVNSMFFLIPITRVAAFSTGTAIVPLTGTTASYALTALRNNNVNLIHSADISIQGKTIEQQTPYLNKSVDFRMLSEMSRNDVQSLGHTLGISELDNPYSTHWNNINPTAATATASFSGNGICNNEPFSRSNTIPGTELQQLIKATYQNQNVVNTSLSRKVASVATISGAQDFKSNNLYGPNATANLMNIEQLNNEYKSVFQVNGNYMIWHDTIVIRFQDLFQSMKQIPLSRRFDATVRIFVNTGTVNVRCINPNLDTLGLDITLQNSTFTATCPLIVNSLSATAANGGVPDTTTNIVAGLYVSRAPSGTFAGVNLSTGAIGHPLSSSRVYYSSVELKPQYSLKYIEENRNRKVSYITQTSNIYTNITPGGSFSTLIQSGVTAARGLVVMPFVDPSFTNAGGFGPGGSPFNDGLSHPLSLLNFQVTVGGVNQLQTALQYTFENFVEQVSLYESLTGSELGLSTGLISQPFWDINRVYFCDLSRSYTADDLTPRTIQLQCLNNNRVPISLLVFVLYEDSFVLDVETGIIKK
jgi:hypothetical protein